MERSILIQAYRDVLALIFEGIHRPELRCFTGKWDGTRVHLYCDSVLIGHMSHQIELSEETWMLHVQFEPMADFWKISKLIN